MKLIMAIVSNEDSNSVTNALTKAGHSFTKLATTGGFLRSGNTTLISGVEDDQVETVISIIAKKSSSRTQDSGPPHRSSSRMGSRRLPDIPAVSLTVSSNRRRP